MKDPAIVVEGLSKVFRGKRKRQPVTAVDNISFTVRKGEIFGFLGPNGAGKTTILLGLMQPSSGQVQVLGLPLPAAAKAVHGRTGYMSQRFTLYDDLTVAANLRFYGRAYGLSGRKLRARFRELVAMAGLAGLENEVTASLPGGWRQRLAFACALIHRPELVFLDEPTAGVDPIARRELWELIYGLANQGCTVFVTTHYMHEAELCQRLAFISKGQIVAMDTPERIRQQYMAGQVLELNCDQPETAERVLRQAQSDHALDLLDVSFFGTALRIVVPDAATSQPVICRCLEAANIPVRTLDRVEPSIEEIFLSTTGRTDVSEEGAT
jgi:ABC-2 type transport system ATP-binding protein